MRKITVRFLSNLPAHEKKITVSTLFTLARILLTPCIVLAMLMHWWGASCILFVGAALTDIIDGTLARWRNEQTFLGAALDPIADKFLLVSIFCTLAFVKTPLFTIPLWFLIIVFMKEVIILFGAGFIYWARGDLEIKPTRLGKATTVFQIVFIMWLFACYFFGWMPIKTYDVMLASMLVFLLLSLAQYLRLGLRQLLR